MCLVLCTYRLGVEVRHMWGMTEISPLGSVGVPTSQQIGDGLTTDEMLDIKVGPTYFYGPLDLCCMLNTAAD